MGQVLPAAGPERTPQRRNVLRTMTAESPPASDTGHDPIGDGRGRWSGRPDGGGGARHGRPRRDRLRAHAVGRPQVAARRAQRAEPDPHRADRRMLARYGDGTDRLEAAIRSFGPDELRAWCAGLGEPTFVGSSGQVFPASFRATPLLRAWLRRLAALGVTIEVRSRWHGWAARCRWRDRSAAIAVLAASGRHDFEVHERRHGAGARRCELAARRIGRRMGRAVPARRRRGQRTSPRQLRHACRVDAAVRRTVRRRAAEEHRDPLSATRPCAATR